MGVAGNLKDLTLIEFLQTLAMSRKSGVLEVHCREQAAWLGVREGAVVRVALSDRNLSREQVLADSELDEKSALDEVESSLWDAAVGAVLGLLAWTEGEFTFEPELDPDGPWSGPEGLVLPSSLSPEFLALEGARLEDHAGTVGEDLGEPVAPVSEPGPTPAAAVEAPAPAPASWAPAPRCVALVAVDPDLRLLEAVKRALQSDALPVHIFQHPDDALQRVKQYFQRGAVPTLMISEGSSAEDDGTRAGWRTLATRARSMVPGVHIVLLRTSGEEPTGLADRELAREDPSRTGSRKFEKFLRDLAVAVGAPE